MKLADHPTVKAYKQGWNDSPKSLKFLKSVQLKQIALDAGANDAGLIDLSRDALADYRKDLSDAMPDTQSVMVSVFRVNQNRVDAK